MSLGSRDKIQDKRERGKKKEVRAERREIGEFGSEAR